MINRTRKEPLLLLKIAEVVAERQNCVIYEHGSVTIYIASVRASKMRGEMGIHLSRRQSVARCRCFSSNSAISGSSMGRGATTAERLRGIKVWVQTQAGLGVECGRGRSLPL